MATLNLSLNGPSITKSYQTVVDATIAGGSSPTYGQWAVYSVSAPLASAFQQDSGKESILKVQSTGDGELEDLIEEFSDGRIQFGFVKVKDPNTTLPKCVLIAWCGAGVPERTKGYFGSHLTAVAQLLHGYHVQVTARSENDLTPEGIVQKVADASGSKYAGDSGTLKSGGPAPPVASKPVFTPTSIGGTGGSFNPLQSRSRIAKSQTEAVDSDGWGADAPPVTRSQLEKVKPAYQPTKVDMASLTSQKPERSNFTPARGENSSGSSDVVKGTYQPIGKVDIAELRRQAQESGNAPDDRPTIVKGAYEPVGKVDIAAIRSRAQAPDSVSSAKVFSPTQSGVSSRVDEQDDPKSLAERSAAFQDTGRLTSLPKPKIANKFGSSTSSFTGTKAPLPGGFESKPVSGITPVGTASRTFADEGGKTPAQIWAERKGRQRGSSGAADTVTSPIMRPPITAQTSGGNEWKSSYSGKSWAPVETIKPGFVRDQRTGEEPAREDEPTSPSDNVSAIRDRFQDVPAMTGGTQGDDEAPPPPLASRPNVRATGVAIPGITASSPDAGYQNMPSPPAQPPRSATPPTPPSMRESSPIRIAQPVARGKEVEIEAPEERFSPPPLPTQSISQSVPHEAELEEEEQVAEHDPARSASQTTAAATFGNSAVSAPPAAGTGGKRAIAQYDYEKAEDNELELKEGEHVINIDMVDEDWWMGENSKGETGLFPSNYVELVDEQQNRPTEPAVQAAPVATGIPTPPVSEGGQTATAQYDYEAAESNELSFPDGAKITNVEFPDEDWWFGEYGGKSGLFPANYVQLDG